MCKCISLSRAVAHSRVCFQCDLFDTACLEPPAVRSLLLLLASSVAQIQNGQPGGGLPPIPFLGDGTSKIRLHEEESSKSTSDSYDFQRPGPMAVRKFGRGLGPLERALSFVQAGSKLGFTCRDEIRCFHRETLNLCRADFWFENNEIMLPA